MPAEFLCTLTKNLTAYLTHNLCAVLPKVYMEKIWYEMYEAAKAVLEPRRVSEYVTCGEVSAAVLSKNRVFTL